MQKLKWTTVQKRVNDLIPQKINPRVMSDKQMSDLKKSLKTYGLVEIPALDFDGRILAGHQRCTALKLLDRGQEIIDVRVPNRKLTKKEADQYLIASNKINGDWDYDLLKSFDFETLEFAGFDNIELTSLFDGDTKVEEKDFDVEKELKKIKKPKTRLGDIIQLGNHKIICGSSTESENLKKLFGEDKASMIYSDPIYNLSIDYNGGIGGQQEYGGNVNDTRTLEEYKKFLELSMLCALSVSKKDMHVFYYCDQNYIGIIQEIYRSLNIINRRVCIWLKNSANPVPTVAFNKVYEPCVYGTLGNPYLSSSVTDLNEVINAGMTTGNNLLDEFKEFIDVWPAKRLPAQQYRHATSKPSELHEKAIKRCTKRGDIVLDSFLGSGSTLIAAETLGRRVYGCELEPVFCDLIIRRYEKLTGKKAEVLNEKE